MSRRFLGLFGFVVGLIGVGWLGVGGAAANGPGQIEPPFPRGETWYVCQGYNTGTHAGMPVFDLVASSSDVGASVGCVNGTSSTGRPALAPGAGVAYRVSDAYGGVCINLTGGGSVYVGHLANRIAHGSGVSAGSQIGTVAPPGQVSNNGIAHIHFQAHTGSGCGTSPKVAFTAANGFALCGNRDFPYSGTTAQWHGEAIVNPAGGCNSATVPLAPRSVSASAEDAAAWVSWSAPSSDGGAPITSYEVVSNPGSKKCANTSGSTRSCKVTGLTNGISYRFTVRARNSVGVSLSATTNAVTPGGAPSAPLNVSAVPTDSSASISWSAPSSNGGSSITGYEVTSDPGGRTCVTGGSGRSCVVTGLSNGQNYRFSVRARNATGLSPIAWSAYIKPGVPPSEPLNVGVSGGSGVAVVTWATPPGTTGVQVWQVLSEAAVEVCSTSGGARACTVSGLTNGETYRFQIRGRNVYGWGPAAWTPYVTPNSGAIIDLAATPPAGYDPFRDDDGNMHEEDIEWMAYHGITLGCGESSYCPDKPLKRQELAAFVSRVLGLTQVDASIVFADVPAGHMFHTDIQRLAASDITRGCSLAPLRFCPDNYVTREEFAAFWTRALRLVDIDPSISFSDVVDSNQFNADIYKIATAGITRGCGAEIFCPKTVLRRDELAAFMARTFRDDPSRQTWLIRKGVTLRQGDSRMSADAKFTLKVESTGHVTISDSSGMIWTAGYPNSAVWGHRLVMQGDGNLVLYRDNPNGSVTAYWSTFTDGNVGAVAVLGTDGKLRILSASGSALKTYG